MTFTERMRHRLGLRSWEASAPPDRVVLACSADELIDWYPSRPDDDLVGLDQTSCTERAWLKRQIATGGGDGAIVELGCWLGAATLALAEGLAERPNQAAGARRIDVYDRFRFDDQGHVVAPSSTSVRYEEGASFRGHFDRRTAPAADLLEVHEGDVAVAEWDPARPIDLLFNDLSKTWDTWMAVRRTFYRALVPGSLVVEQDFSHACTPWLHLSHYRWRPWFEVVGAIPEAGSMVFRLRTRLPEELLDADDLRTGFTAREIQDAFSWAESIVPGERRADVRGARIMLHVLHGSLSRAADELFQAEVDGLASGDTSSLVRPELARRWVAQQRGSARRPVATLLRWTNIEAKRRIGRRMNLPWHAR